MKYTLNNERTNKTISVNFRSFKSEDADSVINCIREAYSDNYFKPNFYDPKYLIELNKSGKIKFLIADTGNDEVAGILSLNPKVVSVFTVTEE